MSVKILHGSSDEVVDEIAAVLAAYEADHPGSQIDLYRHDPVSVWVRVIDPSFAACARSGRHDRVWEYLERLPEDVAAEIGMLVLVAPGEPSLANTVYQEPLPAGP